MADRTSLLRADHYRQLLHECSVEQRDVERELDAARAELLQCEPLRYLDVDGTQRYTFSTKMKELQQKIKRKHEHAQYLERHGAEILRMLRDEEELPRPFGLYADAPQMIQGPGLEMGEIPNCNDTQVHIGQDCSPQTHQAPGLEMRFDTGLHEQQANLGDQFGQVSPLQMRQVQDLQLSDVLNFNGTQAHIDSQPGQGNLPQLGDGPGSHEQQAHIEGQLGRVLPPQVYQWSELEMSNASFFHHTQVHFDGRFGQGLPLQMDQDPAFDMGNSPNFNQQQGHFNDRLHQGLGPQMSSGFEMGNGSPFHGQQALPHQSHQFPGSMMGEFIHGIQVQVGGQYGQSGHGLPLQTSQHPGCDMGNGQNIYQQQPAFASRFGQALPPQIYQHPGFDMGNGQDFYQHPPAFAGQLGHTPTDGQDTNKAPPQPKPSIGDRLDNCHVIVYNGAQWVELRCHVCHNNANSRKKFFENGCAGLRSHICSSHKGDKADITSNEKLINVCFHRFVPRHEIDTINKMVLNEGDALPIAMFYQRRR